jgi:hypothetical protein
LTKVLISKTIEQPRPKTQDTAAKSKFRQAVDEQRITSITPMAGSRGVSALYVGGASNKNDSIVRLNHLARPKTRSITVEMSERERT